MMPLWGQIAGFLSVIAVVVGVAIKIVRAIDGMGRRLERIELRIAALEFQNRSLLKAFPQLVSSLIAAHVVTSDQGTQIIATVLENPPIAEILRQIRPSENPLSQMEINNLRSYVDRLKQGSWLTPDEARDFYRISDIVTREYPATEGSWLLFLVAGIVLGLAISKK
jgi:hypothetical protein